MPRERPDLPNSLPPRGLSREVASRYIGISVTKFDQLVQEGECRCRSVSTGASYGIEMRWTEPFGPCLTMALIAPITLGI